MRKGRYYCFFRRELVNERILVKVYINSQSVLKLQEVFAKASISK